MKQVILIGLMFCSNIVFCPGEGPAYMGLHLGDDVQRTDIRKMQEKQKEQQREEKNFWDHARDLKDRVFNVFSRKPQEQSKTMYTEPVTMFENIQESQAQTKSILQSLFGIEIGQDEETINIQEISSEMFAKLQEDELTKLFNYPDILKELSKEQIQAINPEALSKVLYEKLEEPLNKDFVEKLSWQQVRQLLADHTGWRWKNWLTKFKENFTDDAIQYMQDKKNDKNQQEQKQDIKNEEQENTYLKIELAKLPQDKRPANIDTALKYMREGEAVWKSITSGEIYKDTNWKNLKTMELNIIKLQWYFYKLSILKDGRAFQGGVITFDDPKGYLYTYLEFYANGISPDYKSFWKSWNTKAYARTSSHFRGQTGNVKIEADNSNKTTPERSKSKNIGIDIDVPQGQVGLPLNAPHLLFDQRTNGYVFFKWEPHGMSSLGDVLAHGLSFVKTRGENDESKHSKDRIPEDVKQKFWELYKEKKTSEIKNQIDTNGISEMLSLLKNREKEAFEKYLTQERSNNSSLRNYQAETLKNRRGGEVIINPFM